MATLTIKGSRQKREALSPARVKDSGDANATLVGWSAAAATVLVTGAGRVWVSVLQEPVSLPIALIVVLASLWCLVRIWQARRVSAGTQGAIMACAALACLAIAVAAILQAPAYGTDEIAFDQYAAQLVLHGLNPYGHSMAPALGAFHVPDIYRTYTLSGGAVSRLSYPAGSFLFYIPILLLGVHMQAAVFMNIFAWLVAMFVIWRLLPTWANWWAPILMVSSAYVGFAIGGVTDDLYLPFLALALWRWDSFGDARERAACRWLGPYMLGIAASIKQTPWFLIPFLVIGVAFEARGRMEPKWYRVGLRYMLIVGGVVAIIDVPFAVPHFQIWIRDVLVPFLSPTEPGGQGLVGLTMFAHLGGRLIFYTALGLVAYLVMLSAYIGWYSALKRAWPFLVPLSLYWPTRSFASYLIMMLPALVVAALSVRHSAYAGVLMARRAWAVLVGASGVLAGLALAVKPSFDITVVGSQSTGQLQTLDFLTVRVVNRSGAPVAPHYAITPSGQLSSFWNVVGGPRVIRPHAAALIKLEAPDTQSMPSINQGYILDAFTASPAQMVTSQTFRPAVRNTILTPEDIDKRVPIGVPLHMSVQLTDRLGNAVRERDVRIVLNQVVYAQSGLSYGEASINGMPEGQTPVAAITNAKGIASFEVRGLQAQGDPVFFQAWIINGGSPPSSYSNMVSIQFVSSDGRRASGPAH